jgi:heme o synthase
MSVEIGTEVEPRASASPPRAGRARGAISAYIQLTKPRIVLLLLITTVPSMILAEGGFPSPWLVAATLFGGILSAGGANALNQYLDRDIDRVMGRTRRRPIPSHRIEARHALAFGVALGAVGFGWLALAVNLLAAWLATGALAFYVLVYTVWLKRSSPQNIVIGGAAGAVPVLVGWAAVTGTVGWPAWVLFVVIFLWTPPHFWALAVRYRGDYAAAGVPMLPVVAGLESTTRRILVYTAAVCAASMALWPVAETGMVYLGAAGGLGALFLAGAISLRVRSTSAAAMRLFRFSIVYLALLFGAVAADTLLRHGL